MCVCVGSDGGCDLVLSQRRETRSVSAGNKGELCAVCGESRLYTTFFYLNAEIRSITAGSIVFVWNYVLSVTRRDCSHMCRKRFENVCVCVCVCVPFQASSMVPPFIVCLA